MISDEVLILSESRGLLQCDEVVQDLAAAANNHHKEEYECTVNDFLVSLL